MIKKDLKLSLYWSEDDEAYVVECRKYPSIIAAGETPESAITLFYEFLEEYLKDLQKGKVYKKQGRPRKNNVKMSINISESTRDKLKEYIKEAGGRESQIIEKALLQYFDHVA